MMQLAAPMATLVWRFRPTLQWRRYIAEARRLWGEVDRKNLMINVPATEPRLAAIRTLIAEGVNVNITLLFARTVYEKVVEAFIFDLKSFAAKGGMALGVAAREGRNNVRLLSSAGLANFGAWAEQLIAESSGKNGKGLIPIDGEPLVAPEFYGSEADAKRDTALDALQKAGPPVVRIALKSPEYSARSSSS
jgi:hypothetical protein